ncbi:hypothetical protein GCK72_001372 [Caenorhabditis remanei]|uniref:SH2 domain-containing protein n=1 Tax=Caenorhabditis remanei TaxID=31234 RepID=A0A6A5HPJ3_CAERE|nr:hypothetical protein GCK72_001372 [Caenorhabditis remanei]KAF1769555.1 hypothetical protein GCK72_001372 [Caenorhabditis remanei]
MNSVVSQMRSQVVAECIQHVAATVGQCEAQEINPIVGRIIGEVKEENYVVDLNISSKMVKVIKKNRLIQRHPITYFSFGCRGRGENSNMFGYIAKNKDGTDRRCHVLSSKDAQKLVDTLIAAINVSMTDTRGTPSTSSTPSDDGFVKPEVPAEGRIVNLVRQSPVGSHRQVSDDVVGKVWFHGHLSRDDAQSLLTTAGDFLVRQSDHTSGKFVLSGLTTDGDHKHLILLDHQMRVRTRDHEFNNITELIDYHMTNGIAVRTERNAKDQRETSIMLLRPVPAPAEVPPSPESPN